MHLFVITIMNWCLGTVCISLLVCQLGPVFGIPRRVEGRLCMISCRVLAIFALECDIAELRDHLI